MKSWELLFKIFKIGGIFILLSISTISIDNKTFPILESDETVNSNTSGKEQNDNSLSTKQIIIKKEVRNPSNDSKLENVKSTPEVTKNKTFNSYEEDNNLLKNEIENSTNFYGEKVMINLEKLNQTLYECLDNIIFKPNKGKKLTPIQINRESIFQTMKKANNLKIINNYLYNVTSISNPCITCFMNGTTFLIDKIEELKNLYLKRFIFVLFTKLKLKYFNYIGIKSNITEIIKRTNIEIEQQYKDVCLFIKINNTIHISSSNHLCSQNVDKLIPFEAYLKDFDFNTNEAIYQKRERSNQFDKFRKICKRFFKNMFRWFGLKSSRRD